MGELSDASTRAGRALGCSLQAARSGPALDGMAVLVRIGGGVLDELPHMAGLYRRQLDGQALRYISRGRDRSANRGHGVPIHAIAYTREAIARFDLFAADDLARREAEFNVQAGVTGLLLWTAHVSSSTWKGPTTASP